MDINGFMMHLKQAIQIDIKNNRHPDHQQYNVTDSAILGIKIVSLEALAEAFVNFKSWSELQDSDSAFISFLKDFCPVGEEDIA